MIGEWYCHCSTISSLHSTGATTKTCLVEKRFSGVAAQANGVICLLYIHALFSTKPCDMRFIYGL